MSRYSEKSASFYWHTGVGVLGLTAAVIYLFIGSMLQERGFSSVDAAFFLERAVYAFDGGGMLAGWLLTWPVTPYQMILLLYPFAGSFAPVLASVMGTLTLAAALYLLLERSRVAKSYTMLAMGAFLLHPLVVMSAASGASWYLSALGVLVYVWSMRGYMYRRSDSLMALIAVAVTGLVFTDLAFLPLILLTWPVVLYARLKDAAPDPEVRREEIRKAVWETLLVPGLPLGLGAVYIGLSALTGALTGAEIQALLLPPPEAGVMQDMAGRQFLTVLPFAIALVLLTYRRPALLIAAALPFVALYLGAQSPDRSLALLNIPLMVMGIALLCLPDPVDGPATASASKSDASKSVARQGPGTSSSPRTAAMATGPGSDRPYDGKGGASERSSAPVDHPKNRAGMAIVALIVATLLSSAAGFNQMKHSTGTDLNRAYAAFMFNRPDGAVPAPARTADSLFVTVPPDTTGLAALSPNPSDTATVAAENSSPPGGASVREPDEENLSESREEATDNPTETMGATDTSEADQVGATTDATTETARTANSLSTGNSAPTLQEEGTSLPQDAGTAGSAGTSIQLIDDGRSAETIPWDDTDRYYFEVRITTNTGAAAGRNYRIWVEREGEDSVTLMPQYREGLRIRWLVGTGRYSTFRDGVNQIEQERGSAQNIFVTLHHLTDFRVFGNAPDFNADEPAYTLELGRFDQLEAARRAGMGWMRAGLDQVRLEAVDGGYVLRTGRYNDEDEAGLLAGYITRKSGRPARVVDL
ncbi:MAG: hypothetical protein HLUCCA01_03765 [Bacteroidetes bacterium HLUCCA01]|nr:MAG: hypothetical protein HLUCCA01_03765 [Bacteroidetes bacterium HLUCCA01]